MASLSGSMWGQVLHLEYLPVPRKRQKAELGPVMQEVAVGPARLSTAEDKGVLLVKAVLCEELLLCNTMEALLLA
eukprot:scaffold223535_cov19-Tisochrysis_lutea.AAC.1